MTPAAWCRFVLGCVCLLACDADTGTYTRGPDLPVATPEGLRAAPTPDPECARVLAARASVVDREDGVALSLRTVEASLNVVSLRDYVGHLVDSFNRAEPHVVAACAEQAASARTVYVPSFASSEPIAGGVRVVFKPVDTTRLEELRAYVRKQQQRALACACVAPGSH